MPRVAVEAVLAQYDGWLCRWGDGVLFTQCYVWICVLLPGSGTQEAWSQAQGSTRQARTFRCRFYGTVCCVVCSCIVCIWLNFAVAFPRHQARRRAGARGVEATEWLAVSSCLPQYQVVSNELLKQTTALNVFIVVS